MQAFWEHGYEATTVSDLTRVMGIGAPSLYAAFGDKRALFEEGVAAGELPEGTDTAALARHTGAVVQGMSQQARDGASRAELEALARIAMAVWPRT